MARVKVPDTGGSWWRQIRTEHLSRAITWLHHPHVRTQKHVDKGPERPSQ